MTNVTLLKNGNYLQNTTDVVELTQVQYIAYMVIGIPSWLLYILVITLLIISSNTVFRTAYFKLVILIGLAVGILRNILITMIS